MKFGDSVENFSAEALLMLAKDECSAKVCYYDNTLLMSLLLQK